LRDAVAAATLLHTSAGLNSQLPQVFLFTVVLVSACFVLELVTRHLRNDLLDQIHALNIFSVLDKIRDNKDDRKSDISKEWVEADTI
jgi:hypothetical protein